jgi:hypothetical protein
MTIDLYTEQEVKIAALEQEIDRLMTALRRIRDEEGQVCDSFDLCHHPACLSSAKAWAIANMVLQTIYV